MTSIGPSSQSYNFTHMWYQPDLHKQHVSHKSSSSSQPGTLMHFLEQSSDTTRFLYIVRLAMLEYQFNDPYSNCTLFVPSDRTLRMSDATLEMMDMATARHVVRSSTVDRQLPLSVLRKSPLQNLMSRDTPNLLHFVSTDKATWVNNKCILASDIQCTNGMLHLIDDIIVPETIF